MVQSNLLLFCYFFHSLVFSVSRLDSSAVLHVTVQFPLFSVFSRRMSCVSSVVLGQSNHMSAFSALFDNKRRALRTRISH